jgi:hypothetical protein
LSKLVNWAPLVLGACFLDNNEIFEKEIMFAFASLLYNNLRGGEMLLRNEAYIFFLDHFWNEKSDGKLHRALMK